MEWMANVYMHPKRQVVMQSETTSLTGDGGVMAGSEMRYFRNWPRSISDPVAFGKTVENRGGGFIKCSLRSTIPVFVRRKVQLFTARSLQKNWKFGTYAIVNAIEALESYCGTCLSVSGPTAALDVNVFQPRRQMQDNRARSRKDKGRTAFTGYPFTDVAKGWITGPVANGCSFDSSPGHGDVCPIFSSRAALILRTDHPSNRHLFMAAEPGTTRKALSMDACHDVAQVYATMRRRRCVQTRARRWIIITDATHGHLEETSAKGGGGREDLKMVEEINDSSRQRR
ncbi:hypothetical protein C8R47DRAFT_1064323 [Mycena vitilis]|nr:hypothetical protein C8R47DRAFT_1064323 [Mycena vitilis]